MGTPGKMSQYGLPGCVKVDSKEVAFMSDWSLEQSVDIKDKSFFRAKGKSKTPGIKDWSASCNGQVDFGKETNQKDLQTAFDEKKEIDLELYLNETTFYKGKAYIESLNIDNNAEGEHNIEISIAGNGELKLTSPEES